MKFELLASPQNPTSSALSSLLLIFLQIFWKFRNLQILINFFFFFKKFKLFTAKYSTLTFSQKLHPNQMSLKILFTTSKLVTPERPSAMLPLKILKWNSEVLDSGHAHRRFPPISNILRNQGFVFKSTNKLVRFFMFRLFTLFNRSFKMPPFVGNAFFSFYSINSIGERILILNYRFLLSRWLVSYDFLFNLSYFNITKLFFTSLIFKRQNLALNWETNNWTIKLWTAFNTYFIFKTPSYSPKLDHFFRQLSVRRLSCAVVSDVVYHAKNIFYLKRNDFYVIGLLNITENPYILDYPIIANFENHLLQHFFLKFIVFIDRQSQHQRFTYWYQIWFNNQINYFF